MKKQLVLIAGFIISTSVSRAACDIKNIFNFSAYASEKIDVQSSDFQGLTGAGQSIEARYFRFGPIQAQQQCGLSVSTVNLFSGFSGAMDGNLEITSADGRVLVGHNPYVNFSIPKVVKTQSVNHLKMIAQMKDYSSFYAGLAQSENLSKKINLNSNTLEITLGGGAVQVVSIEKDELQVGRNILISGAKNQTLILNIKGDLIQVEKMLLQVKGLYVRNLFWNFYEASLVSISNLGGTNSTVSEVLNQNSLGIQGYVFAPLADVLFSNTKITGSLFVKNLILDGAEATGQINLPPVQDDPSVCTQPDHSACGGSVSPVEPVAPTVPAPN